MKNLILILAFLATPVLAQTISPVVVECGKHCSGQFTVTNNGIVPLAVIVQPVSFSLNSAGGSVFRPLDATVQLTLNDMSARIGPLGAHTFDYNLKCSTTPCLVTFLSSMTVGHAQGGIAIRVILPHVLYSCAKAKDCRKDVRLQAGLN
jgi:hypothetical protein